MRCEGVVWYGVMEWCGVVEWCGGVWLGVV